MEEIVYKPIGVIYTPHKKPEGTPIQPSVATEFSGVVEVFDEYVEGLRDLDGFTYAFLIFHFHLSKKAKLSVVPYMSDKERGVFATRAPSRPNPIGLSIVKIKEIKDDKMYISDVDILNETPLLDIKPYALKFDVRNPEKTGWLEGNVHKLPDSKDDGRFFER